MRILGIETSCDETAVCLIEATGDFHDGISPHSPITADVDTNRAIAQNTSNTERDSAFHFKIFGNALYSQVAIHAPYGGVFPNLAKREHAKNLVPIMTQALEQAEVLVRRAGQVRAPYPDLATILTREPELLEQLTQFLDQYEKPDIDAIAVTHGPGLEPALWVGVNFARALSTTWNIPIVAVNHMEGHIIMSMARQGGQAREGHLAEFEFPLLSLLISGGHTELVLSKEWMQYERIGETRDDAVGEAFDKVARVLDLPYPGGPEISRLAAQARSEKIAEVFSLPRPMIGEDNYDFSFSGLKTAVKRLAEAHPDMSDDEKKDLAREFEDAAADVLIVKTMRAAEEFGARTVLVGGGVSANAHIRAQLAKRIEEIDSSIQLLIPPPDLATDNAIMIALAGYFHATKKEFADAENLRANGNLRLG